MAFHLLSRTSVSAFVAAAAVACSSPGSPGEVVAPQTASPEATESTAPAEADTLPTPVAGTHRVFDEVPPIHPSVDGYDRGEVVLKGPGGQRWELPVLVARTPQERQHGLMEVPEMPDGTGMAFIFEEDRDGGFWMFGTLMDIDIVYVSAAGDPVATFTMVPCPEQPCPSYPPGALYRNTLEVPGGFWDRIGFTSEWTVSFVV